MSHFRVLGIIPMLALVVCSAVAAPDPLAAGFLEPPPTARPWVYWFIMDGNLSREGITADFEAMQRAGIGGLIMMEVDVGIPRGPVKFLSAEWQDSFAHAVREAERLGLQITLNAGPGWTGSGGPWVRPEQSMQHLVASATNVTGPARFSTELPRPLRRPAFFGDGQLPKEQEKAKDDYYVDTVVLAFPTPAGDQRIADIDEKALYIRAPYSSKPGTKAFLPTQASYESLPLDSVINPHSVLDLSDKLKPDGRLTWDVPRGDWTILRFGRTSTGANTRPAPAAGLGLECDKFDPKALDAHFEAFAGPLLRKTSPRAGKKGGWTSLHIDSWEMGAQNWTTAFREEFRTRRGYDPKPYLPAMTGRVVGSMEISERFLWDLRQTAQELVVENHAQHLKKLARRHGLGLSIEPYDMNPCADMSLGAVADVPMCEFWLYGYDTAFSVIEAASIAHTLGKPIVTAEAFTSSDEERWQAYPGSMKALGDWAFCTGVNRIAFHRYQHQPRLDRRPGMTMGPYGVHWERTQTWWDMVPAYHTYLSRCQYLLRAGRAVADVCFLVEEGAPHVFRPPASAAPGKPPDHLGYNFDACAPETLIAGMKVNQGNLVLPSGATYRVLVLPESPTMTPPLLGKIERLVRDGATVIGPRPAKSPSLSDYPSCDVEVQKLTARIWGECDGRNIRENRFGRGRVIWEISSQKEQYGDFAGVQRVLQDMGVVPDFKSDKPLRFVHRREKNVDLYFVANPAADELVATCEFRVSGKQPELWDSVTGQMRRLTEFTVQARQTVVPLRFAPHQSFFVLFRDKGDSPRVPEPNFHDAQLLAELTGPWELGFDTRWGGPERITMERLEDWTTRAEPGVKFYSGVATYHKTFDLPGDPLGKRRILLDLGIVKNLARVRFNGVDLGVAWCAPWRVDITEAARRSGNQLEIAVANLWPNRLIGDAALPEAQRLTSTTWNPFKAGAPLLESGLIGPVTLRSESPE